MNKAEQELKRLIEELNPLKRKYEKTFYESQNNFLEEDKNLEAAFKLLEDHARLIKEFSKKNDLFFNGCSFHVFEKTYSNRLEQYISYHEESNELDFIENEIRFLGFDFGSSNLNNRYNSSQNRKHTFLKERKENYGAIFKKEKSMSNFLFVRTLDELGVINFLKKQGYTAEKQGEIIGKMLGRHPQNIREKIGQIGNATKKLKSTEITELEKLKKYLHDL
jgi:hypothetical protein